MVDQGGITCGAIEEARSRSCHPVVDSFFFFFLNIHLAEIVEPNDTGPQGESLVVTLSSDEEEEKDITYVGRARQSQGGMKMVMTVDWTRFSSRGRTGSPTLGSANLANWTLEPRSR